MTIRSIPIRNTPVSFKLYVQEGDEVYTITYPSSLTNQSLSITTTNNDTVTTSNGVSVREVAINKYNFTLNGNTGYTPGHLIINGVEQSGNSVSNYVIAGNVVLSATEATQLNYPAMTLTATDSTPSNNHTISVTGTLPSDATGTVTIYLATEPNAPNNGYYLTNPTTVSIVNGQFSCTYTTSRAYYVVAIYDGDSKYEGARVEATSMAYVNYAFTISVSTNTIDWSKFDSVTAAWSLYGDGSSSQFVITSGTETLDENNYVYQNSGILVPTHEIRPNGLLWERDYYVRLDNTDELTGLDVSYDDSNHVVSIYGVDPIIDIGY